MESIFTIISRWPHSLEKYESLLWWKFETESWKTAALETLVRDEALLRVDECWAWGLINYKHEECASAISAMFTEVRSSFAARFLECEDTARQQELFVEDFRKIDILFNETRHFYKHVRETASAAFPMKKMDDSELKFRKEYLEENILRSYCLRLSNYFYIHPRGLARIVNAAYARKNNLQSDLKHHENGISEREGCAWRGFLKKLEEEYVKQWSKRQVKNTTNAKNQPNYVDEIYFWHKYSQFRDVRMQSYRDEIQFTLQQFKILLKGIPLEEKLFASAKQD